MVINGYNWWTKLGHTTLYETKLNHAKPKKTMWDDSRIYWTRTILDVTGPYWTIVDYTG